MKLLTFNAGLAVGVLPYATERVPHVAAALAEFDADVLFVQEVWLEPHWDAIAARAHERFPHAFRAPHVAPAVHGACTAEEVEPLASCAREHCAGLEGEDLARCVVRSCAQTAFGMSTPCLNCIVSHPVGSLEQILTPCIGDEGAEPPATDTERARGGHSAYGPPGLLAYGGSLGTGFLSRLPLEDRDVLVFEGSTLNARGALHARIAWPGLGDVHLFGTHLSPGIAHEQEAQIDRLFGWIEEKAGARARTVVLGDLNTGPNASPSLYRRFERAGFANPYLAGGDPPATFGHARSGWILDHVLFRGFDAEARAERVLDEPLAIDVGGRRVKTTYSDHCGVRATIAA